MYGPGSEKGTKAMKNDDRSFVLQLSIIWLSFLFISTKALYRQIQKNNKIETKNPSLSSGSSY